MSDDNDSFSPTNFLLGMGLGYLGTKALLDAHKRQLREQWSLTTDDTLAGNDPFEDIDDDSTSMPLPQGYLLADNSRLGSAWLPPRAAIPQNESALNTLTDNTTSLRVKAPAHPPAAVTTPNPTYKTHAKWSIFLGIGLMLFGLAPDGDGVLFFVALSGLPPYLWGCACWAKAKGRSGWLGGLLGALGLPGLLILLWLDDRAAPPRQASTRTSKVPWPLKLLLWLMIGWLLSTYPLLMALLIIVCGIMLIISFILIVSSA